MSAETPYYKLLVRTDHLVYARDFTDPTPVGAPFNSILNRVLALQIQKYLIDAATVERNSFPHTCDAYSIDRWEYTYFGFTKPTLDLATRIVQLLQKINIRIGMSEPDVISLAVAITGVTPKVIRSAFFGGWTFDESILDIDTVLASSDQADDAQVYIVIFPHQVSPTLVSKLDSQLTIVEKGGSRHVILNPPKFWILDENALDVDTVLG